MAATLPSTNPCCSGCVGNSIDITGTSTQTGWFVRDTIALMRAIPNASTNVYCQCNGGLVFDDGLGGAYVWRNAATNADDGTNWIKPDDTLLANPGRWKKEI